MTDLRIVTVVCTGNLCRSPMGETFLTEHLRERGVADVLVRSAGTHAVTGSPATDHAVKVVQVMRGDLGNHRATDLDGAMVRGSFLVLCAAREHRDHILTNWDDVPPGRVRLFNEGIEGEAPLDVEDPYGWDEGVYHLAARVIDAAMGAWSDRLSSGWSPEGEA